MREQYSTGQLVRLDENFSNTSIVEVVSQTPNLLFTTVKSNGVEWQVMTYRLSQCMSWLKYDG